MNTDTKGWAAIPAMLAFVPADSVAMIALTGTIGSCHPAETLRAPMAAAAAFDRIDTAQRNSTT
ncbi:hypothetical protein M2405_001317 [Rhodococcus erythropolis]|uniref:DUF4192 domain-containing protein n=1 Tax=Rhodococcus erythropolis TaxID=1833 RepID=UPI0021686605|nr:DUF4192 domain-containing protein [Rhodococcus erythropolis]MCS4253041.1 hypothetical protein [Rhodococcus erythropolis]MCW2428514.1 hypothetical protein [Rhodococcus erythropolis]